MLVLFNKITYLPFDIAIESARSLVYQQVCIFIKTYETFVNVYPPLSPVDNLSTACNLYFTTLVLSSSGAHFFITFHFHVLVCVTLPFPVTCIKTVCGPCFVDYQSTAIGISRNKGSSKDRFSKQGQISGVICKPVLALSNKIIFKGRAPIKIV